VLESLDVHEVTTYAERPYEWVSATASFAVNPLAEANSRIVDLDLVPRDHDGAVRFHADVRLLRPNGGARRALMVVPNRGMVGSLPFSLDTPMFGDPSQAPEAGDGFLLDRGWAIAWCGWQWDVRRDEGWLGLEAPLADVGPGELRIEFRPDVDQPDHALSDSSPFFGFADYPTTDLDDAEATLCVRTTPLGANVVVPRDQWRFRDPVTVELDGGFRAFHFYELVYRSSLAPVVGVGLLAMRDFASHIRDDHDHLFAFGVSQSGRFLRQLLHDGLNVDENGQQVFDGVFSHIASARRGEFNQRHGQPSLTHPLNPGYGPPYDTTSLLERQRAIGGVPKLLLTNSAWEYWRGDGALVHQDAITGADLPEDSDARVHLLAGTDHFGSFPIKDTLPVANPVHHLDVSPVLRALFVQLEEWVCAGVEPSPSAVPRLQDGTAVTRPEVLDTFHDCARPDPEVLPETPAIDPTSTSWPLALGERMVALVSAVDQAGNEVAGIRLPTVAVPVNAFTGWNPRVHVEGLPDVLYEFAGSRLPLQNGASRLDRAGYEHLARKAAEDLVVARFLLQRDVARVVAEALAAYDAT
jgi:Alpha/beta hydrolase domain